MVKTMLRNVVIVLVLLLSTPVINPDNVLPGDWFTPTGTVTVNKQVEIQRADEAAFRELVRRLREP